MFIREPPKFIAKLPKTLFVLLAPLKVFLATVYLFWALAFDIIAPPGYILVQVGVHGSSSVPSVPQPRPCTSAKFQNPAFLAPEAYALTLGFLLYIIHVIRIRLQFQHSQLSKPSDTFGDVE